MRRLLYLVSEDHYFCSHRLALATTAVQKGYLVTVATRLSHHQEEIQEAGIQVIPLKHFHRSRMNPFQEIASICEIYKIYREVKPDLCHQVALKPVLYGSFVAWILGIPRIINTLGGLGYLFISQRLRDQWIRHLLSWGLRFLLNRPGSTLVIQNPDDQCTLTNMGVSATSMVLIPGSGVNLRIFKPRSFSSHHQSDAQDPVPVIALVSRMVKDKGIQECIEALRLLKERSLTAHCIFYGEPDPTNPTSLTPTQLHLWEQEGLIVWKGRISDVAHAYQQADIAILPSYREGLPQSLVEAAACGLPLVTTDVPGCREIVQEGENGFLVSPKNSIALAQALETLILDPMLRHTMGQKSRAVAIARFDQQKILADSLALYANDF